MLYIKILKNDTVIAVEAHSTPVYVFKQPNGVLVRCSQLKAQGILSVDGSVVYQLEGKEQVGENALLASVITTTEYLTLVETLDDLPEKDTDEDVDTPTDDPSEDKVMTTTEMRERILALEEELAATKIILGVD